jgi:ABC-2 type transport system ATP-binding protein
MVKKYMRIETIQVGKRFRSDWVIYGANLSLLPGQAYALSGPNGSGKSTLLRMLSGHLSPSLGKVQFFHGEQLVPVGDVYAQLSFAAPYMELIEEFTLLEALQFHQRFRPFRDRLSAQDLIDLLAFPRATHKQIRNFSSGMKQRLKLALAFCAEGSVLFLDEPTTNLDRQGMDWYQQLAGRFLHGRLTVVASNVEEDFSFCPHHIDIASFKKPTNRSK